MKRKSASSGPITSAAPCGATRAHLRGQPPDAGLVDQKKVQHEPDLSRTLEEAQEGDVLELDEAWSFVRKKTNKKWLWTAMCRRTRQIVAFVIGDHSARTCARLWSKIPARYERCHSFSDLWKGYRKVFDAERHESVGKEAGETNHMERWYGTLRQRLGRYVRRTLSFSKSGAMHHMVTKWFIMEHNRKMTLRS